MKLDLEVEPTDPQAAIDEQVPGLSSSAPLADASSEAVHGVQQPKTSSRRKWLWVAVAAIVVLGAAGVFAATRKSDQLTPIAQDACDEMDGAIMLQVNGILSSALNDAEDAGYSGPELGDKMRELCPLTMLALDSHIEEQDAIDALPTQMELDLGRCGSEKVTGTVKNNSDQRVDIFIEVTFENSGGVQVSDSNASVSGLQPGRTANWDAYVFEENYDTCSARVSGAYPAD